MENKAKLKLVLGLLAMALIAVMISWAVITTNTVKEDKIKIGVIAPLSGPFSFWGESIRESLLLDNNPGVELIFEDSKCDAKEGISAANKLINVDKVQIIIGDICSSVTLAITPLAEKNKVVLITFSQSSAIKNAGDYIFRISLPNDIASKSLANKVYSDMNRKVAVLYVLNELGKDYEQQFTKSFKEMGGEITDIEGYEVTEKDFSTPLSKIRETDSDALIIFTNLEGVSIAKTIAKLNIRTKLYGGTTWNSKPNYAGAENILNDLVYPISKVDKNSKYDIFMKLFQDKYGKKPSVEWMAINSYDALNILMQTIAKTGYNGEKIKNYLYKVKYVGLNGEITFDKNGDYFNKVQMMQLKDGKTIAIN